MSCDVTLSNKNKRVLEKVKEIKEYCEKYGQWPKQFSKCQSEQERQSTTLWQWLYYSNYSKGNFKYIDILTEEGVSIKVELDELFKKYGKVSKRSKEHILIRVKELKEYCKECGQWPKHILSPQTEQEKSSKSLWKWLNESNYNKNDKEFKYINITTEDGTSVKQELDELFKCYGTVNMSKNKYVLVKLEIIKEYCEKYGQWPQKFKKTQTEQEKLSKSLWRWLYINNYKFDSNEFRFANILTKEGITIKEELDKLYMKYGHTSSRNKKHVLLMLNEITEYCEEYGQWPKIVNNPKTIQEKKSKRLRVWLKSSYYNNSKKEFKYINVLTKDKVSVKEELDRLYCKYNPISLKVKEIKEYCEMYGIWPVNVVEPKTEQEKTSKKLYEWLNSSKYNNSKKEFKYNTLVNENGFSIKEELDILFRKYKINKEIDYKIISKVKEIKNYCEKYGEWPKQMHYPKTEQEKLSTFLWRWLYNNKYDFLTEEFKYSDVLTENKVTVKEELDRLYAKYNHISLKVKAIKEYCEKYGQWPKHFHNPQTEQELISTDLLNWLKRSNYNNSYKEFKYSLILNEEGISVKDILDKYYAIYGKRILKIMDTELININIWQAKDSKDIAFKLYYYLIKLEVALRNNDEVIVKYYYDSISLQLNSINMGINSDYLLNILELDRLERLEIVYNLYTKYSIENNREMALLFKNLYYYWDNANIYKRVR